MGHRRPALAALLLAAGLALTGCGSGADPPSPEVAAQAAFADHVEVVARALGGPAPALEGLRCTPDGEGFACQARYRDPNGSGGLATGRVLGDGSVERFTFRPDVRLGDGRVITAEGPEP